MIGQAAPWVFLLELGRCPRADPGGSNVGAVVLLVPLAVDLASAVGADPRLAALAVALAASNVSCCPRTSQRPVMGPGVRSRISCARAAPSVRSWCADGARFVLLGPQPGAFPVQARRRRADA
jgi:hypothetical protein